MNAKKQTKPGQIADLTVDELRSLIRETVHDTLVEVFEQLMADASHDAEVNLRAELTTYLRNALYQIDEEGAGWELDD